jgi:hypothetical protein
VRAFFYAQNKFILALKFSRKAPLKRVLECEFEGETKKFSIFSPLIFPWGNRYPLQQRLDRLGTARRAKVK